VVFPTVEARAAAVKFGAVEGGEQTLAQLDQHLATRGPPRADGERRRAPHGRIHLDGWKVPDLTDPGDLSYHVMRGARR
jgi:hypothetical protein